MTDIVEVVEKLSRVVDGLNELDDRRAQELAQVRSRLTVCEDNMRALSNRLQGVLEAAGRGDSCIQEQVDELRRDVAAALVSGSTLG